MTPERYRQKALEALREAIRKREFWAACCPDCEAHYRPLITSWQEALRVAEMSVPMSAMMKRSSGRIRRLLELSYLYAWGPEGSEKLRDEWHMLYEDSKERGGDLFYDGPDRGFEWMS